MYHKLNQIYMLPNTIKLYFRVNKFEKYLETNFFIKNTEIL